MAEQLYGVYLLEHNGDAIAFFRDADQAQRFRRTLDPGDRGVVLETSGVGRNADAVGLFSATTPPAAPTPDPDEELKGQIRARLEREEREARLTEEVKAELAADAAGAGATTELRGAGAPVTARGGGGGGEGARRNE